MTLQIPVPCGGARDASEVIDPYHSYGADVLKTSHDGALRFTFERDGQPRVETWHDDAWHRRLQRTPE